MDILLFVLIILLVLILLVVLYISCVPIDILVHSEKCGAAVFVSGAVQWGLFGIQHMRGDRGQERTELLLMGRPVMRIRPKVKKPAKKPAPAVPPPPAKKAPELPLEIILDRNVRDRIFAVLGAMIRAFSVRSVNARVRLGTTDPAATGIIYGYFMALRGMLWPVERLCIAMDPVYDAGVLDWQVRAGFRISCLIRVIVPALRLLWQRPVRTLVVHQVLHRS